MLQRATEWSWGCGEYVGLEKELGFDLVLINNQQVWNICIFTVIRWNSQIDFVAALLWHWIDWDWESGSRKRQISMNLWEQVIENKIERLLCENRGYFKSLGGIEKIIANMGLSISFL